MKKKHNLSRSIGIKHIEHIDFLNYLPYVPYVFKFSKYKL